jgi:hypothetical protein
METVLRPATDRLTPREDGVARTAAGAVAGYAAVTLLVVLVITLAGAVALTGRDILDGAVDRQLGFGLVLAVSFAVLAHLIARHEPGNLLAVVAAAIAGGFGLSLVPERHSTLGAVRGWPGVTWTLWTASWI